MSQSRYSPSQIIIFIILLTLASYSGWLFQETTRAKLVKNADNKMPDFIVLDVSAIQTSITGSVEDRFMSPKVVHFAENDTAFYEKPHIISYSSNGKAPWDITALKGKSLNGTQQLILWNNVKIHEQASALNNDTWLTTSWLIVYPDKNYAETDKPVTFSEPDLTVNSVGMRIYFKEKRVELLNQAQGVYDGTQKTTP